MEVFMDQTTLFIGKIYVQSEYYLSSKGLNLNDTETQDELNNVFLGLKDYIKLLDRPDKDDIYKLLPDELVSDECELSSTRMQEIVETIKTNINEYNEFVTSKLINLENKISTRVSELGFNGSYPRYFRETPNEILFLEYDDDLYFNKDKLVTKRIAMLVKVKKTSEIYPDLDIEHFSYLDLITKYVDKLQNGDIKSFMIHLPNLNYLNDITDDMISNDIKYLELVENVINGGNRLPKWYINVNKTKKDFEKTYMMYSIVPTLLIISVFGLIIFRNNSSMLLICYIVGFILNVLFCKYFGNKSYHKYHNEDELD